MWVRIYKVTWTERRAGSFIGWWESQKKADMELEAARQRLGFSFGEVEEFPLKLTKQGVLDFLLRETPLTDNG